MARQWTAQQKNAIYATDGSVLVSAAAGSGKTAVLVERVIQLITSEEKPIDVDRLLIVTFTRDAASEMKERISYALSLLLEADPYNPNLLRQKQLLYNASISTIDSFCSDIVREYFHTLNISRDFRIADKGELEILKAEALDIAFENYYKNGGDEFICLADAFSGKSGDAKLRDTVLRVADFLSTQPFPDKWMDNMLRSYGAMPIAETIWGKIIINNSHSAVSHAINLTENSIDRLSNDETLREKWIDKFENDLVYFTALQKKLLDNSWDDICSFIYTYEAGRLMPPRGYKDNPVKLAVAANRDEVKSAVMSLQSYFNWSEEEAAEEISQLSALTETLFSLVKEYNKNLSELKSKKNVLSFSDVELLTVKLLAEPKDDNGYIKTRQAEEITNRYDAVMVDEFQDVNDVQDLIFKCVSRDESNLFVVGDVKQSIYGFRQAKPEIFMNRKNLYNRFDEKNPIYPATIILDKNFRSREEICNAVNFIFQRLMTAKSAKMDYDSDEMLIAGASYPQSSECNFEIALIDKSGFSTDDNAELEAFYIADRIHKMISSGFYVSDGSSTRRATYGDFAIIMRSPKTKAMKYVNTLIKCGIPAYSETKESLFDTVEIKIMLNLLRVIDNPTLDIPLLSVMCSPIYGFEADELAAMRADSRHSSLYSSVKAYAQTDERCADFISELSAMRDFSCISSVDELLSKVYEMTSFCAISLAVSGSDTVAKNLNLLREYARSYEANGYKTLSDFIAYIDRLVANGTDLSASSSSDNYGINSVRVLSIHSSKGLEFPVCFIADTAHKFNKTDLNNDILIDSNAGLGVRKKYGQAKYETLPRLAVGVELRDNEIAEEMRVLYVALTRAREKLIVVSTQANAEKYLGNLYSKVVFDSIIEPYSVMSCKSISDWICLCALVNPALNEFRSSVLPSASMLPYESIGCDWIFSIVRDNEIYEEFSDGTNSTEAVVDVVPPINSDSFNYAELLKKNLSFKYKNADVLTLPQKVTASDIAHTQNNEYFEKVLSKPSFLNKDISSSVERGTAHHKFLQLCDFNNAKISIDAEISRLICSGALTKEQAECIDKSALEIFAKSELVSRIMSSKHIMREERFTAKLEPDLILEQFADVNTDEKIIIQGAVDLAFEEDGMLVIVDYKTDRVGDIDKLKTLYSKQLLLYKQAMEQSTGLKVKECVLYSVHLNNYILV